jgi:rhodanese-related sulfurtransferase
VVWGIWWEAAGVWRAGKPGSGMIMPTVIGREELRTLTWQGAQLAEVLPAEEYAWAHLPGAASVPLKELDARAGQLDRSRPVIVYCHDSL